MAGCLLVKTETLDGVEYDCEYENAPTCDDCIYGAVGVHGGWGIDPETGKRAHVCKEG